VVGGSEADSVAIAAQYVGKGWGGGEREIETGRRMLFN
jgi:hypothetical protein